MWSMDISSDRSVIYGPESWLTDTFGLASSRSGFGHLP